MRIFPILGWMLFPGCWAVTGPGVVSGPTGGSVTVRCRYQDYKRNQKFWCRKGSSWFCSNRPFIVETDGSEAEVKRGRISIRDNHTLSVFTVTVENLTRADAGTYHCGVERRWWERNLRDTVELTISLANSSPHPTERSSSATSSATANSSSSSTARSSSVTVQPASSSPSKPTSIWTTAEEGTPSISHNQGITATGAQDSDTLFHILLPCVLLVLILFLLAAVMLVRLSKKRKKGASVQRDKKIHLSNLEVGNNTAGGSPEHAARDSPAATDQTGFYSNVEPLPNSVNPDSKHVEIQPHGQGSEATEEVSYVTVTISTPDQQPIYANTEQPPKTTCPANLTEETLYSAVK